MPVWTATPRSKRAREFSTFVSLPFLVVVWYFTQRTLVQVVLTIESQKKIDEFFLNVLVSILFMNAMSVRLERDVESVQWSTSTLS